MLKYYCLFISFFTLAIPASDVFGQASAAQYLAAGDQMIKAKDYDKAVLYYRAAIQLDSRNSTAYQGLGNAYYYMGRKPEALAAYEKASALNPGNAQLTDLIQSLKNQLSPSSTPTSQSPQANGIAPGIAYSAPGQFDYIEINLMGGLAPGSTLASGSSSVGFGTGLGLGASAFYLADPHLGIGLQTGFYTFSQATQVSGSYSYYNWPSYITGTYTGTLRFDLTNLELLAMAKYKFGGKDFWPYLVGGGGLSILMAGGSADLTYSNGTPPYPPVGVYGGSDLEPMVEGGAGLAFKVSKDFNLLVEGKYAIVFGSGSFSYIPINLGVNFNL